MANSTWRETAELVGFASIVASLIFVGMELRQSQQVAIVDSSATRASWFFSNRASINEHADVWVKGNSSAELTLAEKVIYANLVRDIHTNNRFTWSRERRLGDDGFGYAAHEMAWILYNNPNARAEWEKYVTDIDEMRSILISERPRDPVSFTAIVRADLEKLDGLEKPQ